MEARNGRSNGSRAPKEEFLGRFAASVSDGSFRRLTLGKHRGTEPPERIVVGPVVIKDQSLLAFRLTYGTREQTKNFPLDEALTEIERYLGNTLHAATLFTADRDVTIQYSRKGVPGISSTKPSIKEPVATTPNREKQYFIHANEPFLQLLGISNAGGSVRSDKFDKFRQINKFVEIVDSLLRSTHPADKGIVRVVDFGSGKNYLTFALYSHLTHSLGVEASIIGVETRPDLVEHGNTNARLAGFDGLTFREGEIASSDVGEIDMVVALHACDTATDDALVKAVTSGASIIAVAPCCQKYVRGRMQVPKDLAPLLKHGIMEERFAESLTNGLRALVLEAYGYDAKVFEFIAGEHTAKNIMITATKREHTARYKKERREEIQRLKEIYGLSDFYLDRALGI